MAVPVEPSSSVIARQRVGVRIGACQTPEILGDVDTAVPTVHDFAEQAKSAEPDLLLLPECFLKGYLVTEPSATRRSS
jgi:predicted amidohydrolase